MMQTVHLTLTSASFRPRGVRRAAKAALAWTQRLTPPSAKSPLSAQQHPPGLTAEAPPNPSQTSNLGAAQLTGTDLANSRRWSLSR